MSNVGYNTSVANQSMNRYTSVTMSHSNTNVSFFHMNIRSIGNKINLLESLFMSSDINPNVICITEHWLTSGEEAYCNMTDYRVAVSRSRPTTRRGNSHVSYGGVLIYLQNNLNFKVLDILNTYSVVSVCEIVGVKLIDYDILVLCVYRPPEHSNFRQFCEIIEQILSILGLENKVCLCGDLNIKFNLPNDNDRNQ
uniref:Endonuclease/exonuclease/phosphatase domain-containing protein n=1 Tax=Cacopsylla melanoneura TaxID=428564 RepID=A0A8D8T0Q4_9HEMI